MIILDRLGRQGNLPTTQDSKGLRSVGSSNVIGSNNIPGTPSFAKITVSTIPPSSPSIGDFWVDIS
jgi:hypothetical protein